MIVHHSSGRPTMVAKSLIFNPSLSAIAKWIVVFIDTLPENQSINSDTLSKEIANTTTTPIKDIKKGLKELLEHGHIVEVE